MPGLILAFIPIMLGMMMAAYLQSTDSAWLSAKDRYIASMFSDILTFALLFYSIIDIIINNFVKGP